MNKFFTLILILVFIFSPCLRDIFAETGYPQIPNLKGFKAFVLTYSISTSILASTVLQQSGAQQTSLEEADFILTVVRSNLNDPLNYSYSGYVQFIYDVESCMNMSGSIVHVYLYQLESHLRLIKAFHSQCDWQVVEK